MRLTGSEGTAERNLCIPLSFRNFSHPAVRGSREEASFLSLSLKKKASCFMHEKIADFPSQDKVQGLSRLQTLSKQSHVLKGWGNGGAGG